MVIHLFYNIRSIRVISVSRNHKVSVTKKPNTRMYLMRVLSLAINGER